MVFICGKFCKLKKVRHLDGKTWILSSHANWFNLPLILWLPFGQANMPVDTCTKWKFTTDGPKKIGNQGSDYPNEEIVDWTHFCSLDKSGLNCPNGISLVTWSSRWIFCRSILFTVSLDCLSNLQSSSYRVTELLDIVCLFKSNVLPRVLRCNETVFC